MVWNLLVAVLSGVVSAFRGASVWNVCLCASPIKEAFSSIPGTKRTNTEEVLVFSNCREKFVCAADPDGVGQVGFAQLSHSLSLSLTGCFVSKIAWTHRWAYWQKLGDVAEMCLIEFLFSSTPLRPTMLAHHNVIYWSRRPIFNDELLQPLSHVSRRRRNGIGLKRYRPGDHDKGLNVSFFVCRLFWTHCRDPWTSV